ncbi:MAG: hypothetical protein M1546_24215, partial [Chloroflexi bacterium]|nr:hypothetical protein [Chloroflexota bacterium]
EITGTYPTLDLNTLNTATTFGFTRYGYDALANTTVISYDTLGRKTGMTDPDMGAPRSSMWQYSNGPIKEVMQTNR